MKIILLAIPFLLAAFLPIKRPSIQVAQYNTPADSIISDVGRTKSLAIVGDIQRTSIWEYFIGREENDPERILIINEIKDENPAAVVLLGDMVFDGSDPGHWRGFDSLMLPLIRNDFIVLPVLGNHEYFGNKLAAMRNIKQRFPVFDSNRWYSRVYDGLALVFVDSNEDQLPPGIRQGQREWYVKTIRAYDADPTIDGILVFLHHPPYSNSVITGDEPHVQRHFVPAFVNSRKGLAMFAGHAHTYERFQKHNKTFITSGGGGGPRVLLRKGASAHQDLCTLPSPRPFHFLILEKRSTYIRISVRALDKGKNRFYNLEQFNIAFSN
jgi:hypothetical protein